MIPNEEQARHLLAENFSLSFLELEHGEFGRLGIESGGGHISQNMLIPIRPFHNKLFDWHIHFHFTGTNRRGQSFGLMCRGGDLKAYTSEEGNTMRHVVPAFVQFATIQRLARMGFPPFKGMSFAEDHDERIPNLKDAQRVFVNRLRKSNETLGNRGVVYTNVQATQKGGGVLFTLTQMIQAPRLVERIDDCRPESALAEMVPLVAEVTRQDVDDAMKKHGQHRWECYVYCIQVLADNVFSQMLRADGFHLG